jgi:hypothetical protein
MRNSISKLMALLIAASLAGVACESDVYWIDLQNDTADTLFFAECLEEDCRSTLAKEEQRPNDSRPTAGIEGRPHFWRVTTKDGTLLGCFALGIKSRRTTDLRASTDLKPCPMTNP